MINLKAVAKLVIYIAALIIIFQFNSSCKSKNYDQVNQKKEKAIQEREKKRVPFDIWAKFIAAGWLGDGEYGEKYVQLFEAWKQNPHSPPICIKIVYHPGPKGWAGIYWQNKPDNWGDQPGENFQKMGYKKLTFWAKGEKGGEVVEFKAGGINAPVKKYRDSFEVSLGKVVLKKTWKQYIINLENEDLSSVIGGFCWVTSKTANPEGLTFYLDDIYYEF
ncbi:MAG: hypothetical protein PVH61_13290 [Candidatus Aminicenantes bacterium]